MSDLISRKSVIEIIRKYGICGSGYSDEERINDVLDMIESEPSAQQWIPVEERLPEKSGNYLVCSKDVIWVANYFINTWWGIEKRCRWGDVEAWMPLPEPYKGK